MIEIQCLACGKTLKIPRYVDTDNYEGQIVCTECESLLYIKLVKSKVRQYKIVEKKFRRLTADELARMHLEAERELREQGYIVDNKGDTVE